MSELGSKQYEEAPVIERVLGALVNVDANVLVKQMDKWREIVKKDFSREEITTDWKINIEEVNGFPLLGKTHSIMRLFYRHWRDSSTKQPVACLQSRPDGFFVNMRREPNDHHSFEEVFELFTKWLPIWSDCFEAQTVDGTILHYVNELSERITPQFISDGKSLMIGRALGVFSNFGDHFPNLIPPYDCKATMKIPHAPQTTISLHSKGLSKQNDATPVVHVEIIVKTLEPKRINQLQDLLVGCRGMHDILIDGFHNFFTKEALSSFKPK